MCLGYANRPGLIFTASRRTHPCLDRDQQALRMRIPRLRSSQNASAVATHATVAPIKTSHSEELPRYRQAISAKAASPIVPRAAPAASTAATFLALLLPATPARSFCCFSCFSISEALAGKMAGKARNNPPMAGPNCLAMTPAATVMRPPKRKRTEYSYQRVCRSPEPSK